MSEREVWASHQAKLDRLAALTVEMHAELDKMWVAMEKLKEDHNGRASTSRHAEARGVRGEAQ